MTFSWNELTQQAGLLKLACLTPSPQIAPHLLTLLGPWMKKNAGTLSYIDAREALLTAPFANRPWAKSLLIFSFLPRETHSPILSLPPAQPKRPFGLIAPYALQEDYHKTGQECLEKLIGALTKALGPGQVEGGVDSAPVLEKPLAELAGIGHRAPNSLLFDPQGGCGIHLGTLFTSHSLPQHILPPPASCTNCRQCIQSCPTGALSTQDGFSIRKCRAWLSGEHRGPLTWQEQKQLGTALFGCGLCTTHCPQTHLPPPYAVDLLSFLHLPSATITRTIRGTPLEHSGTTLLKRNAIAILGQQLTSLQRREILPILQKQLHSPVILDTLNAWIPTHSADNP